MMVKPEVPDFKFTENSRQSNVPPEYEEKVVESLRKANTRKLNHCDAKAYDLLVKIEKEVSWEVLLKLKSEIFLAEGDEVSGWENPYLNADYAKHSMDKNLSKGKKGHNESFYAIQKSASIFMEEKGHHGRNLPEHVIEEEKYEESRATEHHREQTAGDKKGVKTKDVGCK
jgi:hypothetical protein